MKRLVIGAISVALLIGGGALPAQADPAAVTLTGGSSVFGLDPAVITASATVPGSVAFSVDGVVVKGCEAVATATVAPAPYLAKCSWAPAAAGAHTISAVLTPTDTTVAAANSNVLTVKTGLPVQGTSASPISMYVDTVLASGTTGVLAGRFGVSCAVTSQYIIGQTIVFRVYANNADLGGAVMDTTNTAKAYIEVAGVPAPIALSYGNHSGVAFWTGVLKTGTAPGLYSTLGVINYKVTMIAKDTNKAKTLATKRIARVDANGKAVLDANGKPVYDYASYYRTVTLRNPIKGATGTWKSNFTSTSLLTLYAVPTA